MEALYTAKLGNEEKGASLPDFKTKPTLSCFQFGLTILRRRLHSPK